MESCRILHENSQVLDSTNSTELEAAQLIGDSYATNTTIVDLSIDATHWNRTYFEAILLGLQRNRTVQRLAIRNGTSSAIIHQQQPLPMSVWVITSMVNLFQSWFNTSNSSLRTITLDSFDWTAAQFAPIAQSIQQMATSASAATGAASSSSFETIALRGGSLDAASCILLQSLFSSTHNTTLSTLDIDGSVAFPKDDNHRALEDLVSGAAVAIGTATSSSTSSTGAKTMKLVVRNFDYGQQRQRFNAILRGLCHSSCTVQELIVDGVTDGPLFALFRAMPDFVSVKDITLDMTGFARYKQQLMTAFRRNSSLLDSNVVSDFMVELDHIHLWAYHERNRQLAGTLQSHAMALASGMSNGMVVPSLLALAASMTTANGSSTSSSTTAATIASSGESLVVNALLGTEETIGY